MGKTTTPVEVVLNLHPTVHRKLLQLVYIIGLRKGQDLTPDIIVSMGLQRLWAGVSIDEAYIINSRPQWKDDPHGDE